MVDEKGFFGKWLAGMRSYGTSVVGQLELKMVFFCVVVVGLFGGGVQRLLSGDGWMSAVLLGFGFITLFDLIGLFRQHKALRRIDVK